jgi:hypothetical protein
LGKRYLIISIFALFLAGCAGVSALLNQNTDLSIENSELIPTNTSQITSINEEVDKYTRDLHNRIEDCIGFRDTFDFTINDELIGPGIGTKKVKECIDFILDAEPPDRCNECGELDPLVEMFTAQTLESLSLIEEGYEHDKPAYISEGLITFWDADIVWEGIRITINNIRREYNLSQFD